MIPNVNKDRRSPNFNTAEQWERFTGTRRKPDRAVVHTTEGPFQASMDWLCNPASGVSCHYLVDQDGLIHELVDPNDVAWHAGESDTARKKDGPFRAVWGWGNENTHSIGVEVVRWGDRECSVEQHRTVAWLLAEYLPHLFSGFAPSRLHIISHRDITTRKSDPVRWDWTRFWEIFDGLRTNPLPTRFFPETGYWVSLGFLSLFNNHGLAVTGYPLTEEYQVWVPAIQKMVTRQIFENVMMEWWPGLPEARFGAIGRIYIDRVRGGRTKETT